MNIHADCFRQAILNGKLDQTDLVFGKYVCACKTTSLLRATVTVCATMVDLKVKIRFFAFRLL